MRLSFWVKVLAVVWALCLITMIVGYIGVSCTGKAEATPSSGSVVYAVGDSITAGSGTSGPWRDGYAQRAFNRICGSFCGTTVKTGNLGHPGQCLVVTVCGYGPTLLQTFPQEVYGHDVTTVLVEIGRNDLSHATDDALENGFLQLAQMATTHGMVVVVGTIPPAGNGYSAYWWTEPQRRRVNQWIRSQFSFVMDFEAVLLAPNADYMWPPYDSGDKIHPSDLGAVRMADMLTLADVR